MRACPECFNTETWSSNTNFEAPEAGFCDFCDKEASKTWSTLVWQDAFSNLFGIYEAVVDSDSQGMGIHLQLQDDWKLFSYTDPTTILLFLHSVFPQGHEFLVPNTTVRLHFGDSGINADHRVTWSAFSEEIRKVNRYFPKTDLDLSTLKDAILGSVVNIPAGHILYRARLCVDETGFKPSEMGAPPPSKAAAGRANPVGIPYLYLSYEEETSVYETRVANYTKVAIGKFKTVRDLKVLNLAQIQHPDYFAEVDPTTAIVFFRLLQRMGQELKKPIRSSDQPIDYIPTQYLCELAKSSKLDGVLYSSSLKPGGSNVVLFDTNSAQCRTTAKHVRITSLQATWVIDSE